MRTKSLTQDQQALHYLIITLAFLLIWAVLCINLNEPFFGHREGGNIWIASAIRSFVQFGPENVDYLPIRTPGPTSPETGLYYMHHPPLIVWFTAIGTGLFGYDTASGMPYEMSIRMVGLLAAMPTLSLLYVLARRLFNHKIALISFLLYSFTPMVLYFGRMPYYDMVVMPFILTFAAVFVMWMRDYNRQRTVVLLILAVVTMWVAWAGAFFFVTLGVVALIYGNRQQRKMMVIIGVITALATLAIPLLYETLKPGTFTDLYDIFLYRASNAESGPDSAAFTLTDFIIRWLKDMLTTLSFAITICGVLGIVFIMRRPKKSPEVALLALFVAPFLFMIVFRNAFHFHDWYKIHFMPGFVIASAVLIDAGWSLPPEGIRRYARPLIFAMLVTSLAVTVYWTVLLYSTTDDQFARKVADELSIFTQEDDLIGSNIARPYTEIEYYGYRNILWGVSIKSAAERVDETTATNTYYLLCLEENTVESYNGLLSELPYQIVAGSCRLISLTEQDN